MEKHDPSILMKDLIPLPLIQKVVIDRNQIIYLDSPDFATGNNSIASLDWDKEGLHLQVICSQDNFHDYEIGGGNPRLAPHKQGNSIAFYFQPSGKTNFYQFEFASRKIQAAYYCFKAKDGKYKQKKMRNAFWQAKQQREQDIWAVTFDIPWETVTCSDKSIIDSHFLVIQYKSLPSSPVSIVINSMRLPGNQLRVPQEWNIIKSEDSKCSSSSEEIYHSVETLDEMRSKYFGNRLNRNDFQEKLAGFYCELLNKLYVACDCLEYNETFRRLERFNNLPEFWDSSNRMQRLIQGLQEIYETKCLEIIEVIHLVMEGATYLANQELQVQKKKQNQHEHERLEKSKRPPQKKTLPYSNNLIPCFKEIQKKEDKGIHFGRLGPQRFIYEHCPRKWRLKFATFRKKYSAWQNDKCPDQNSDDPKWDCPYGKKCQNFEPEL